MHKLFTVCTEQVRSPYTEHAASRLPNPTHLEGEVRFDQAEDQQVVTTRSPRIVTECLLTLSILIKMYVYAIYILICRAVRSQQAACMRPVRFHTRSIGFARLSRAFTIDKKAYFWPRAIPYSSKIVQNNVWARTAHLAITQWFCT